MTEWLDHLSGMSLQELIERPEVVIALLSLILVVGLLQRAPFRRRSRGQRRDWSPRTIRASAPWSAPAPMTDPKWQLEIISRVAFEPQPLLNKGEYQVLILLETVVRDLEEGYRVMAQTSHGEILKPKKGPWNDADADLAYRAINSKRADFVVVDRRGIAVLAVEYQGHGHYQGNALMRDAVKREVFRKANVAFLEVPAEFEREDVVAQVRRILDAHNGGQTATLVNLRQSRGRAARLKRHPVE